MDQQCLKLYIVQINKFLRFFHDYYEREIYNLHLHLTLQCICPKVMTATLLFVPSLEPCYLALEFCLST
jgi:hypothetical protein